LRKFYSQFEWEADEALELQLIFAKKDNVNTTLLYAFLENLVRDPLSEMPERNLLQLTELLALYKEEGELWDRLCRHWL